MSLNCVPVGGIILCTDPRLRTEIARIAGGAIILYYFIVSSRLRENFNGLALAVVVTVTVTVTDSPYAIIEN